MMLRVPPRVDSVLGAIGGTPLVRLGRLFPNHEVFAKLEYFNPTGSMKDRSACHMVGEGLREGSIQPGSHLVESSSGNFGVSLAMVAQLHGLKFTCVVDPKIPEAKRRLLELWGAEVDEVAKGDANGSYLCARIDRVQELLAFNPGAVWLNQYANADNWRAFYQSVGAEILEQLPEGMDVLVMAVSTCGSIMGVARRLREKYPRLRVVAVDAVGSIIFGAPASTRDIPGIGANRVPEQLDSALIDTVVHVPDRESVAGCRALLNREGVLAGGSSGSVMAAVEAILPTLPEGARVVVVLPDRGDLYLDSVYNPEWVEKLHDAAKPSVSGP